MKPDSFAIMPVFLACVSCYKDDNNSLNYLISLIKSKIKVSKFPDNQRGVRRHVSSYKLTNHIIIITSVSGA